MQRSVSCRLDAELLGPCDVVLSVAAAESAVCSSETMEVSVGGVDCAPREVLDGHGTRLHLLDAAGPGRLEVRYEAVVVEQQPAAAVTDLDRIRYTRPSRYGESDELSGYARTELGGRSGFELLAAATDLVGSRLGYVAGSSRQIDGAVATLLSGQGVCRDFAHLVIALVRACDTPARMVSVYAPGLDPMDFHAVAEVAVDGAWWAVDATLLAPRSSLVRIATGRDAADTPFLTTTGAPVIMGGLEVMAVADPILPVDDPAQPARLG